MWHWQKARLGSWETCRCMSSTRLDIQRVMSLFGSQRQRSCFLVSSHAPSLYLAVHCCSARALRNKITVHAILDFGAFPYRPSAEQSDHGVACMRWGLVLLAHVAPGQLVPAVHHVFEAQSYQRLSGIVQPGWQLRKAAKTGLLAPPAFQ